MNTASHSEDAFERVIEAEPPRSGRMRIAPNGVDRERAIALLKEGRAALIAGAVTGQLSVAHSSGHV